MKATRVFLCCYLLAFADAYSGTPDPMDHGDFVAAIERWRSAAADEKDPHAQVEALIRLGTAYQALGQQRSAVSTFEHAMASAEKLQDRPLILRAKTALAGTCSCMRKADWTDKIRQQALDLAVELNDHVSLAVNLINAGNTGAAQGHAQAALSSYRAAAVEAGSITNRLLLATALANAAAADARFSEEGTAESDNRAAVQQLEKMSPSHEVALLYLRCGQTAEQLHQTTLIEQCYRRALKIGEELNDSRASTYALGYLGHLRERAGDLTGALELTRQAAFLAQEMPEALYRWEWQTGRILKAQSDRDGALAAYRRAAQTLQPIRADLAQGCGSARPSYREAVAPLYYEYADLLLAGEQLVAARDVVEQLKTGELEDYLQDECAGVARGRVARIEKVATSTAVIYLIPLADRTELLVGFHDGMQRFHVPVTSEQLTAAVRQFRLNLEKRTTNQYLVQARQLYQWLITPLKETLAARRIDTLVFVPDGALRTIPMGALEDGEHFLVEQYAVAVTPGLTLMEAQPMARGKLEALAAGVAEGVQNFPPLPHASEELTAVHAALHGPLLLDRQFMTRAIEDDFAHEQYRVVHLATHGQFDKDISRSFLLTYDGRLSFDDLERLLRPGQFRGKPVELLTLSACQTAAGDDRAALGLAGVAVKAGARSALATLWFVHDESTALLMSEFYTRLRDEAGKSKARALQRAQLKVLQDPRFGHPAYWAPYLIIGNWL